MTLRPGIRRGLVEPFARLAERVPRIGVRQQGRCAVRLRVRGISSTESGVDESLRSRPSRAQSHLVDDHGANPRPEAAPGGFSKSREGDLPVATAAGPAGSAGSAGTGADGLAVF